MTKLKRYTPPAGALSARQMIAMTCPLMLEGLLSITVGFVDTLMVSSLGENAISAVSTIDAINVLLNEVILAIATGGTVVMSQHIGQGQLREAAEAGRQAFYIDLLLGCGLMVLAFLGGGASLGALFPALDPAVAAEAKTYFRVVCLSYPFLALFHCGSAVYRAQGMFRVSMMISLLMNLVNAGANALFIFGFGQGVAGAAAGTVAARVFAAAVMLWLLGAEGRTISLGNLFRVRFSGEEILRILRVGVPCGLENTLFHIGKILLQGVIAVLGTSAIAANALVNQIAGIATIPANAFCIALLTLVGNAVGAQNNRLAKEHVLRIAVFCEVSLLLFDTLLFLTASFWVGLFGLGADISAQAVWLLRLYCVGSIFLWMPSFLFPSALRAANDARFTMSVSFVSMWIFRIGCAYVLVLRFAQGLRGIWICMLVDWFVRGVVFSLRLRRGVWTKLAREQRRETTRPKTG